MFEGDLAYIAVCHLKENDLVYVAGQLIADPPPLNINKGPSTFQVKSNYMEDIGLSLKLAGIYSLCC